MDWIDLESETRIDRPRCAHFTNGFVLGRLYAMLEFGAAVRCAVPVECAPQLHDIAFRHERVFLAVERHGEFDCVFAAPGYAGDAESLRELLAD